MAPRSPGEEADEAAKVPYREGWAALTRMMEDGASWSGHERDCAYLNLGDGRFVDGSAALGLDHGGDGRALATCDLDGDGGVELVLRARTAPTLRILRGATPADRGRHWVALGLRGTACNTDGIGAVVQVVAGGRARIQHVAAGEGYLAQSSTRLTFGLGTDDAIERVTVRWPGGDEEHFTGVEADARFRLVQGTGTAERVEAAPLAASSAATGAATGAGVDTARVVLRAPLPLAPQLVQRLGGLGEGASATLVTLWAGWCQACRPELREFAEHAPELKSSGLALRAVDVDAPEDQAAAAATFAELVPGAEGADFPNTAAAPALVRTLGVLLEHVVPTGGELPLPTSLLLDRNGAVQIVYKGAVTPAVLAADARALGAGPPPRSSYPGRWLFGVPRDLAGLARELRAADLPGEAALYATLDRLRSRGGRRP